MRTVLVSSLLSYQIYSVNAFLVPHDSTNLATMGRSLKMAISYDTHTNDSSSEEDSDSDVSWNQFLKKDNTMSVIMSASFVAKDWIQSLPCAMGIADCDMPEKSKLPATAKGAGMDQIDAVKFLSIKRVKPIDTSSSRRTTVSSSKARSSRKQEMEDFEEVDVPIWQDLWRNENTMSTIMSASFIPMEWIQSLPCAMGIADCDMPEKSKLPATAKGAGMDQIETFLNIKRVKPIEKKM
jgi:hypothetical protein